MDGGVDMFSASIFAGSGRAPAERIDAGLARARGAGIVVGPVPQAAYAIEGSGYLAGDDNQRRADLDAALGRPADLLWASRGGYGLTRLLPLVGLDLSQVTVLGFSDVTALLAAVYAAGGTAIHGPVLTSFADADEASIEALRAAYGGRARHWRLQGGAIELEAPVIGGNLEVLTRLIGGAVEPQFAGRIVVLEDIGEPWYRCDRALTHLLSATDLSAAAAVVLGEFHDCEAGVSTQLAARLEASDIPCLRGAPVGHGSANQAFIWGESARLEAGGLHLLGQSN
jgi:muramoyltetrapeptide carboxypeptidase